MDRENKIGYGEGRRREREQKRRGKKSFPGGEAGFVTATATTLWTRQENVEAAFGRSSFSVLWRFKGRACNGDADNGENNKAEKKLCGILVIVTGRRRYFSL